MVISEERIYVFFFRTILMSLQVTEREKIRMIHQIKTWKSFLRQASYIHEHANGTVFYDLRYHCDVFTHKSHRIAIELSQSARSDLLDASNDGYSKKRAYAYPGVRKKYLFATGGKTDALHSGVFGDRYWDAYKTAPV